MGAKQSKRSVDITTTPKKGEAEIAGETEGKVEKIEDVDVKVATNGGVNHADIEYADNVENEVEKGDKEKGDAAANEEEKTAANVEVEQKATADEELSAQNEKNLISSDDKSPEIIEETPGKEKKKKEKKYKWSIRSLSFTKKDKSKPTKDCDKSDEMKQVEEVPESQTAKECQSPKDAEEKAKDNAEAVAMAKESSETKGEIQETPAKEEKSAGDKAEALVEIKSEVPGLEVIEEKPITEETPDEVPPPLPTSNPPSDVIESIKAEPEPTALTVECLQETVEKTAIPSNETESVENKAAESQAEQIVTPEAEKDTFGKGSDAIIPKKDEEDVKEPDCIPEIEDATSLPQPLSEVVANSDSIPDISTESLPSLPEPLSETLPEPTSLPPLEAVPNPITESFPEPDLPAEFPDKVTENGDADDHDTIMTNGNTNGHLSPGSHMNGDTEQPIEEPVKLMKSSVDLIEDNVDEKLESCEIKKAENTSEPMSATCEE